MKIQNLDQDIKFLYHENLKFHENLFYAEHFAYLKTQLKLISSNHSFITAKEALGDITVSTTTFCKDLVEFMFERYLNTLSLAQFNNA